MAEKARQDQGEAPDARGTMDLTSHMKTWLGFWTGVKWSSITIVVVLLILAIFRTN